MPKGKINGLNIFWEVTGTKGDPLVLVHGSWGDHHNWDTVIGELSETFRVVTYDRRGHSESERPAGQGSVQEDISDLAALTEHLGFSPAHIAGSSFGAAIVLKTAAQHPGLFKSLIVHEPPLFDLLRDVPQAQEVLKNVEARINAVRELFKRNETENATRQFIETIGVGPGAWDKLSDAMKQTFIFNAPTWYDEVNDAGSLNMDVSKLSEFKKPALLTDGDQSPPFFPLVLDKFKEVLPHARRFTFQGAGHVPHISHPEKYVENIKRFCLGLN